MMNEGGGTYVLNKLPLHFSGRLPGILNVEHVWASERAGRRLWLKTSLMAVSPSDSLN